MRILVVAATPMEVAPLVSNLRFVAEGAERTTLYTHGQHQVTVLTTGVGMVATACWCSRALAAATYDLALNVGVCGAFDRNLELGSVVHVVSDRIAELGAEDDDRFISIHELGLVGEDEFPFTRGQLVNPAPPSNPVLDRLPATHAITVNTAHGSDASVAQAVGRWNPDIESMEGAAFMYSCLTQGVAFSQVRAVSNIVERRNRDAWRLSEAIDRLGGECVDMLSTL